ncbi:MAG: M48 family metalloprotease [Verrucomicrobia bacterium]|nr:M48 family metalloprotease [Verrucomicrobiota bacterium]
MDFFARQDKARKNTKLLVFYFVIAVLLIIASVYFVSLVVFAGVAAQGRPPQAAPAVALWNPQLLLYVALGTLAVVACGSAVKISQLASGGGAVAQSLGGRRLSPKTNVPDERKLLNVVEEMALASGVPVPQVYVLDREMGINAFAAGHTPGDAAIGVTRGCIQLLKRDELQGVIAHEFSHILNGDMRLNLRLMGIIFGILCLAVVGRVLIYTRGRKNPLPLLGLALIIIGWVGVFFGRLIQAAVSRQREFLADAAAVQFTRNPAGLSGALQKIGGLVYGSKLTSPHAAEASHMFFGNGLGEAALNSLATHPPLEKRIRAIDPHWDGKFPRVIQPVGDEAASERPRQPRPPAIPPVIPFPRPHASALAAASLSSTSVQPQTVLPSLGAPTALHLRYAEELRDSLPDGIQVAAREPLKAVAMIYALLLSHDAATREQQLLQLARQASREVHETTAALVPEVQPVAARARLPLVELAMPALRELPLEEFQSFTRTLKWLIENDRQIDLFEFVLQKIIRHHLEPHFAQKRPPAAQYYSIKPLVADCGVLLSALAHIGGTDPAQAANAFRKGASHLRAGDLELKLLPREKAGLAAVDAALNRLALAVPQIKKNLLEACVQVVGADGVIQEHEAELLRAIADTLDCPIPPFVKAQ